MAHSYIAIPDANIAPGAPAITSVGTQLRDNPIAIAEGHTDAPRIAHQALSYQDFTSSDDFVVPDYCSKVFVQLCGGGAGSGSGVPQCGGYAEGWVSVTPGDIITVTVGQGGTGCGNGGTPAATSGSTSSFGSYMSATGGAAVPSAIPGNPFPTSGVAQDYADWIVNNIFGKLSNSGRGVGGDFNMIGSMQFMGGFGRGSASAGAGVAYGESGVGTNGSAHGYNGKSGLVRVWY